MSFDTRADDCPRCGLRFRPESTIDRVARMTELLQSNDPPRESELVEIREKVAARTERLSTLDTTISELEDTLKLLQAEREWVRTDLKELKQISHPVRKLPSDVLSEIFLACITEDVFSDDAVAIGDSLNIHNAPWVLLRICRHWRGVSKAFPRLWSTIELNLDHHCDGHISIGTLLLLGVYLQRSGTHSLNVWIQSRAPESEITSDNSLLQVLLPSSYRWKCAVIVLHWDSFEVLDPLQGSLESLELLHVQNESDDAVADAGQLQAFRYTPKLHWLVCYQMCLSVASMLSTREQLTNYEWYAANPSDLIVITPHHLDSFRQSPLLEECTLDCSVPDGSRPGLALTLSNLRLLEMLVMEWGDPRVHGDLCNSLTLPALETLTLKLHHNIQLDVDCLIALFQRSQCKLITLHLAAESLTDDQLLELLQASPSLRTISVSGTECCCFSDRVIERLKRNQDVSILPHLTHIILDTLSADPALFVEMIESRTQTCTAPHIGSYSCLESVQLTEAVDLTPDLVSRMEECCSRGLVFVNGE